MPYPELLQTIDALSSHYLDVLEDMCNLESPTADKARVDAVGEYIQCWARGLNLDIIVRPMEGSGNPLCITLNPKAEKSAVVFSGHIDTVHPVGLFPTPAVHRDETKLYGPGTTDCKGGVAASMLAMAALQKIGFADRPVKLVVQTDEETSSKGSNKQTIAFMVECARGAAAFLNAEGYTAGQAVLIRKGIARYRLNVTGKAVHSAVCYTGISAIAEAARKVLRLEEFKEPDGITCNCGVINGGTVGNAVAEKCSVIADFRFATPEQYEQVQRTLRELAETNESPECRCEVELVSYRPPMVLRDHNVELLEKLNAVYAGNGMEQMEASSSRGGSDAAYTTEAGIPTIDSIGVRGARIHSVEEYMIMESLVESAKRLALAAVGL